MTKELLLKLMDSLSPSGYEKRVRNIILNEIKDHIDEYKIDRLGNLIVRKKGKGEKIMLAAHMDEIGLMVEKIENSGLMKISTIGGIEPITLVGQPVTILRNNDTIACDGVISFPDLHEGYIIEKIPKISKMYIDTGLSKKDLERLGVEVGCYVIPRHRSSFLGNGEIISGKALDDRTGCYILIEVIKGLKKYKGDIYFVFTVQEEIGLYGSKTSVYNINPSWGIVIDTTTCPDASNNTKNILGYGPYLTVKDSEIITNKCLNDQIRKTAKKNKIPLQLEVSEFGTTDAAGIMFSKEGVPSSSINVPTRNLHSTVGIVHWKDIQNTIKLLKLILENPIEKCEM